MPSRGELRAVDAIHLVALWDDETRGPDESCLFSHAVAPRVTPLWDPSAGYARTVTEPPEMPEFDPRAPLPRHAYGRKLPKVRKPFRVWIKEPGSWLVLTALSGFFGLIWGACFFSALMMGPAIDVTSLSGTLALSFWMLGVIVGAWTLFYVGPKVFGGEGGFLDVVFSGMLRKPGAAPELDESPAMLARKRGDPQAALRLYRQWVDEFPHRLDLRFHVADIEHHEAQEHRAALRGYKDFLRRIRALEREATAEERELVPLAEAHVADLEREGSEPPARRVIKI